MEDLKNLRREKRDLERKMYKDKSIFRNIKIYTDYEELKDLVKLELKDKYLKGQITKTERDIILEKAEIDYLQRVLKY